ncbi:MAG: translation initiation factor IF-5A [Candidatus Hodarchaeota archaeon]
MEKRMVNAGSLKVGKFIIIGEEPCKIVSFEKSKAGKHGHAKVRMVAIGFFDNSKRSVVYPADASVETPIIDKRTGQVISKTDRSVMIMDMENYQTIEVPLSDVEEGASAKLEIGGQVEYWNILGKRRITRAKGA